MIVYYSLVRNVVHVCVVIIYVLECMYSSLTASYDKKSLSTMEKSLFIPPFLYNNQMCIIDIVVNCPLLQLLWYMLV